MVVCIPVEVEHSRGSSPNTPEPALLDASEWGLIVSRVAGEDVQRSTQQKVRHPLRTGTWRPSLRRRGRPARLSLVQFTVHPLLVTMGSIASIRNPNPTPETRNPTGERSAGHGCEGGGGKVARLGVGRGRRARRPVGCYGGVSRGERSLDRASVGGYGIGWKRIGQRIRR